MFSWSGFSQFKKKKLPRLKEGFGGRSSLEKTRNLSQVIYCSPTYHAQCIPHPPPSALLLSLKSFCFQRNWLRSLTISVSIFVHFYNIRLVGGGSGAPAVPHDLSLQLQRSSLQSPSSFSSFSSSSSSAASSSPPSASTQKAVPTHCPKSDHSFPFLNDDVSQECKCKSKIHNILIGCCTICTHHM